MVDLILLVSVVSVATYMYSQMWERREDKQ